MAALHDLKYGDSWLNLRKFLKKLEYISGQKSNRSWEKLTIGFKDVVHSARWRNSLPKSTSYLAHILRQIHSGYQTGLTFRVPHQSSSPRRLQSPTDDLAWMPDTWYSYEVSYIDQTIFMEYNTDKTKSQPTLHSLLILAYSAISRRSDGVRYQSPQSWPGFGIASIFQGFGQVKLSRHLIHVHSF